MAKPSFNKFAAMLDQTVDSIPPHFLCDLTGGFNLQKCVKREGEYYILGEYIEDGIGTNTRGRFFCVVFLAVPV